VLNQIFLDPVGWLGDAHRQDDEVLLLELLVEALE